MTQLKETVIEKMIYIIRDQKVMLDSDLAELYGVETRVINQSVQRNPARFPKDFMFQLTQEEHDSLRSQFVISKKGKGGGDTCHTFLLKMESEHSKSLKSETLLF